MVLFTDTKERAKAFAVYGRSPVAARPWALLLGGVLTEYADWRWCFWVNLPVAVLAIVLAIPIVPESKAPGDTSYDVPGAVLVLGLASFVYGFTRVAQNAQENAAAGVTDSGWAEPWALVFIGRRAARRRVRRPRAAHAQPAAADADRARPQPRGRLPDVDPGGAGLIGAFFFLSLYFQQVLPTRRWRPASRRSRPRSACSCRPVPPAGSCPRSGPSR